MRTRHNMASALGADYGGIVICDEALAARLVVLPQPIGCAGQALTDWCKGKDCWASKCRRCADLSRRSGHEPDEAKTNASRP